MLFSISIEKELFYTGVTNNLLCIPKWVTYTLHYWKGRTNSV